MLRAAKKNTAAQTPDVRPPRMSREDAVKLIACHAESRRENVEAAYAAMKRLSPDDRAMVVRWISAGAMNELALGQVIAEYRRALGRSYGWADAAE